MDPKKPPFWGVRGGPRGPPGGPPRGGEISPPGSPGHFSGPPGGALFGTGKILRSLKPILGGPKKGPKKGRNFVPSGRVIKYPPKSAPPGGPPCPRVPRVPGQGAPKCQKVGFVGFSGNFLKNVEIPLWDIPRGYRWYPQCNSDLRQDT